MSLTRFPVSPVAMIAAGGVVRLALSFAGV
jgi:hypothetical protein